MFQLATTNTWQDDYAAAYSYGHNVQRLSGRRLDHFAHAFADLREEVHSLFDDLDLTLDAFWLRWDRGDYFGTPDGNWHVATDLYIAPR